MKLSALTWNVEFELTDGPYSKSDTQDYFEYILKRHGEKAINPSIRIYPSMKLLGSTKSQITKDKKTENIPYLEIIEVVLIKYNVILIIIGINKI